MNLPTNTNAGQPAPANHPPEPPDDAATQSRRTSAVPTRRRSRFRTVAWRASKLVMILLAISIPILVFNAMRMSTRQLPVDPVKVTGLDDDAIAQTLMEVLAEESVSDSDRAQMKTEPFTNIHQILQTSFPNVHATLQREKVNDLSLLYCWPGRDPSLDPILLMSHLDVVPVDQESIDQWTDNEGKARLDERFVWGRGALDVKCGVVSMLAAADHLLSEGFQPERTIYMAMGHDEEVGGDFGNRAIAQQFIDRGTQFKFVLDEGGAILQGIIPGVESSVAFVAIAEKTPVNLTVTARGEGGHGSMPGRSAILNLAECITRIDEHPMPARMTDATATLFEFLGPEMPFHQRTIVANRKLFDPLLTYKFSQQPSTDAVVRTTMNVTQIFSSSNPNQSATEASATINARLLPGDTIEDVQNHILEICEDLTTHDPQTHETIAAIECQPQTVHRPIRQLVSPVDCEAFRNLQKTIHQVFPDVSVAAGLTSVSTDSAWYFGVSDHVYRFIPMRVNPYDMERIHGIDERIERENLGEIVRFYVQLLKNTAS